MDIMDSSWTEERNYANVQKRGDTLEKIDFQVRFTSKERFAAQNRLASQERFTSFQSNICFTRKK